MGLCRLNVKPFLFLGFPKKLSQKSQITFCDSVKSVSARILVKKGTPKKSDYFG